MMPVLVDSINCFNCVFFLQIKLGDFGLATTVGYDGERKRTLCGTPNYIAPEVLSKKGHSFEVDVWSIGCILYTLLVGKPPFETETLKDTYNRIKNNEYHIPTRIGPLARKLIFRLLQVIHFFSICLRMDPLIMAVNLIVVTARSRFEAHY